LYLVCATIVIYIVQLHLSAQQSSGFVDVIYPELVALLERHAVGGEVS
jgi:hypothetical protein